MISLSVLVKYVMPEVMGCPAPLIERALLSVCRDFCDDTHVWQEDVDDITLRTGTGRYELPIPDKTALVAVKQVFHIDDFLTPKALDQLNKANPNWRADKANRATFFAVEGKDITITPKPTESVSRGLSQIKLALKPTLDAVEVGDVLVDEYGEYIAAGTASKLQAMPGKDWSDLTRASINSDTYERAKSRAKIAILRGKNAAMREKRNRKLRGAP